MLGHYVLLWFKKEYRYGIPKMVAKVSIFKARITELLNNGGTKISSELESRAGKK